MTATAEESAGEPAWLYMDAMRTLLAVTVAFGHLWGLLVEDYRPTGSLIVQLCYYAAGFAHSAVVMFFVLSGYWIARSVTARVERGWSWRDYLGDRGARLVIVLIPALILGGVLDAIGLHVLRLPTHLGQTDTWVLAKDVAHDLGPGVLLGNLLFLQDIVVAPYGTNGPLWSVAFEFWYYLWFPALWLSLTYRRFSLALVVLLVGVVNPELAFGFVSWSCGALLHFAEQRARQREWQCSRRAVIMAAILCGIVLAWGRTGDFGLEDPIEAAAFALFLFTLLRSAPRRNAAFAPLALFGARASFSLYAIHFPLMALVAGIIVGGARRAPDSATMAMAAAILAGVVAIAWGFAALTEANTGRLRRLLRRATARPETV
ncbi:acyltransferase family protein [Sphingomonas sp. LT1P40]|uniref:acyltransferase family protein n=1 Tax=Alteristakelama amylovorans TaxID=3096166 RepID=UPI002FC72864